MKQIRAHSLRRNTDHVFEDFPVTDSLMNALQYERPGDCPQERIFTFPIFTIVRQIVPQGNVLE